MATRLKNMHLTSVDLVRAGANQEADICLYKSAQEPPEQPTESETNILKQFIAWLRKSGPEGENEPREEENGHDEDFMTFDQIEDNQQANETLDFYLDALEDSYISIQHDAELDDDAKGEMMLQSLEEFNEAMKELIPALAVTAPWKPHHTEKSADKEAEVDESARFEEIEEVTKYNKNHDPSNGQFSSGGGGGAASKPAYSSTTPKFRGDGTAKITVGRGTWGKDYSEYKLTITDYGTPRRTKTYAEYDGQDREGNEYLVRYRLDANGNPDYSRADILDK